MSEAWRLIGTPRRGGVLIVADHAANRVPADIHLGIVPERLNEHVAWDIGVAAVAEAMVQTAGFAAFLGNVSRLVCDFNREEDAPGLIPAESDGVAIPGNRLDAAGRAARIARFYQPYHAALAAVLAAQPPRLIVSLHSFTPVLALAPHEARPWQVGVLYNEDDRMARAAIPWLAAQGLIVGDQLPYSGKLLNATMNRHAEACGRRYLGIELRQDEVSDAAGQRRWAQRLVALGQRLTLPGGDRGLAGG